MPLVMVVPVPMLAVVTRMVVPLRVRDMWTRMRDVGGVQ